MYTPSWHGYGRIDDKLLERVISHHIKTEEHNMGRMRENPRYNVISMRISDEEREQLESLMSKTKKSVSDIMREAMEYFSAQQEQQTGLKQKAA